MRIQGITRVNREQFRVRVVCKHPTTGAKIDTERVVSAKTEREAVLAKGLVRQELLAEAVATEVTTPPPLGKYFVTWLERRKPTLAHATGKYYDQHLAYLHKYGKEMLEVPLDKLAPVHVVTYLAALVAKPYAGNVVTGALRVLRTVTADGKAEYRLPHWACERVSSPKPAKRYTEADPNLLTPHELGAVLGACRASQWGALAATLALTGLRFAEASALRWEDVDTIGKSIRVRRSQYCGVIGEGKNEAAIRSVPLVPMLEEFLASHRRGLIGHPGTFSGLVFPSKVGTPVSASSLRKGWLEILEASGVTGRVTIHGLRRTLNNMLRQVAEGQVTRAIIGHSSEEMTALYSLITHEERASAVASALRLVPGTPLPAIGGVK